MSASFAHEKLRAYQEAIRFAAWVEPIVERLPAKMSARDQPDRSSTRIALNIAEGNGRRSAADRCRYLDIARGSAVESAACLDVHVAKKKTDLDEATQGKEILIPVVSLVSGLIARFAPDSSGRLNEEPASFPDENEND